jgi:hypothetical protein
MFLFVAQLWTETALFLFGGKPTCSYNLHSFEYISRLRSTVTLDIDPPLVGIGDHADKKTSVTLAALSAVYQLQELGIVSTINFIFHNPFNSSAFLSLFLSLARGCQKVETERHSTNRSCPVRFHCRPLRTSKELYGLLLSEILLPTT